ncbi:Phosphoribosylamine--glycine ligase [hydrothermal vent metagenome]|uniref:phosphoribosylamine--glycine ligase n=1 Tax=hydrothermal vent metagenome TaxID=652676 RepID=A0A3B0S823_9ZZZZ
MLVGSGGREHALAWKLAQSPLLSELVIAPGSDAIAKFGRCEPVGAEDVEALVELAVREAPALVVVGPEVALAAGLADRLQAHGILVFGPRAAAAQLEASKAFTKALCARHNIPAARSKTVTTELAANAYLDSLPGPYVLKADGLAAGKGVVIAERLAEAKTAAKTMLDGQFGAASAKLVIEEFLSGEEASLFVLCDGKTAMVMAGAQDHKRAFDGDTGPNTGGMGCYSAAPVLDADMCAIVMQQIIQPTLAAMADEGAPFCGILYAGLMIDQHGPKLIEYNVRFGDPECQILMRRLRSDLLPALLACARGELAALPALQWDSRPGACVVLAAKGYPGDAPKGSKISRLAKAEKLDQVMVFHAGTKQDVSGNWRANGGRVLNVTALGDDLAQALDQCYLAIDTIDWPEGFCRRDIGWRAR